MKFIFAQNFDFELGPMIPPNQALPQMEEPAPVAPQGYGSYMAAGESQMPVEEKKIHQNRTQMAEIRVKNDQICYFFCNRKYFCARWRLLFRPLQMA